MSKKNKKQAKQRTMHHILQMWRALDVVMSKTTELYKRMDSYELLLKSPKEIKNQCGDLLAQVFELDGRVIAVQHNDEPTALHIAKIIARKMSARGKEEDKKEGNEGYSDMQASPNPESVEKQ